MNFMNDFQTQHSKSDDSQVVADAFYTTKERQLGKEVFHQQSHQIMRQVYRYQQEQHISRRQNVAVNSMNQKRDLVVSPIFTFLRDPVSRFLSSIGQALQLNGLGSCRRKHDKMRKDQNHENKYHSTDSQQTQPSANVMTIELLDCVLAKIESNQFFLDQHLLPQSFQLYTAVMDFDIGIAVMDLSTQLTPLLRDLSSTVGDYHHYHQRIAGRRHQPEDSSSSWRTTGDAYQTISSGVSHRRRKSPTIVQGYNLSLSLLTPSIKSRICSIYHMDVLMIQMTNVTTTICS